ncbi:hypothetical protein [Arsenophonus nasoniae]|uniref:hypothetical protein n=1 Tax=Arsenophonus nasoniae TaxID=638 RepID=UPI0038797012
MKAEFYKILKTKNDDASKIFVEHFKENIKHGKLFLEEITNNKKYKQLFSFINDEDFLKLTNKSPSNYDGLILKNKTEFLVTDHFFSMTNGEQTIIFLKRILSKVGLVADLYEPKKLPNKDYNLNLREYLIEYSEEYTNSYKINSNFSEENIKEKFKLNKNYLKVIKNENLELVDGIKTYSLFNISDYIAGILTILKNEDEINNLCLQDFYVFLINEKNKKFISMEDLLNEINSIHPKPIYPLEIDNKKKIIYFKVTDNKGVNVDDYTFHDNSFHINLLENEPQKIYFKFNPDNKNSYIPLTIPSNAIISINFTENIIPHTIDSDIPIRYKVTKIINSPPSANSTQMDKNYSIELPDKTLYYNIPILNHSNWLDHIPKRGDPAFKILSMHNDLSYTMSDSD